MSSYLKFLGVLIWHMKKQMIEFIEHLYSLPTYQLVILSVIMFFALINIKKIGVLFDLD